MNMKKTNNNSPMKRIAASATMLAVSAAMLGTSTYAWFTMNKYVTVTGMEVKTTVSSNLLISHGTFDATTKNADSTFTTSDSTAIKAWLQPVSTNNADSSNYWYTLNAKANGAKDSGNYTDYDAVGLTAADDATTYGNKFSQEYGVTKDQVTSFGATTDPNNVAVGYVDYVFQLKATNTTGDAESIYLTKLDLTYAGATDNDKAFRAAVFAEEFNESFSANITTYTSGSNTNYKGIYAPASSAYQTPGAGVSGAAATTAISNLLDGEAGDSAIPLATIAAGNTKYYKVVVRLWIEGEDTTCTSETFANLNQNWALDLRLDLGNLGAGTTVNDQTPVKDLGMVVTPVTP
jgi:hypothetical protein